MRAELVRAFAVLWYIIKRDYRLNVEAQGHGSGYNDWIGFGYFALVREDLFSRLVANFINGSCHTKW